MKMFNKLLFIATVFCGTLVFGATSTSPTIASEYTTGVNNATSCKVECPPMKTGYFSRIASFDYQSGSTECYVYSKQSPTKILAKVVNENNFCKGNLINPTKVNEINSTSSTIFRQVSTIKTQVLNSYTGGSGTTFVSLPKYMVAGLMADDEIINIPTSISMAEVQLNSGYTNTPNVVLRTNTGNILDSLGLDRAKYALAGSVTFVIDFLASSNSILMSLQVALFMFSVAMSLGLLLTQKGTKKASQIQDHEDFAEKILFGVVSILVFFLPLNKIATTSGDISQSGYQQLIRPFLYLGVETADKLAITATSSVLKYNFGELGVRSTEDYQQISNALFIFKQKRDFYKNIYENSCLTTYKTEEISNYNKNIGSNLIFPNSEYITVGDNAGALSNRPLDFYNKTFMVSESQITSSNIPSVSFCFMAEKNVIEFNNKISDFESKIKIYEGTGARPLIEKNLKTITELAFKNNAEFGFVSIANLATTTMAFKNFDLFDLNEEDKVKKNIDVQTRQVREATGYEVSNIVEPSDSFISPSQKFNELITQAPLFMLPMASNVKDFVRGMFDPIVGGKDSKDMGGILGSLTSKIRSNPVTDFILSTATNLTVEYFVTIVSLGILLNILMIAPLIAMIGASFLVMAFYFLSIEILYIVIPFASIFAFSTGNLEIIKNLVKQTFILAVKPVLIVVSVLMAMFVYEMFQQLNEVIVTAMFEPLFALSNNLTSTVTLTSNWDNGFNGIKASSIFLFMKSTMLIASSVITIFVCFYLVFNGANIILDILGIKDSGFDTGGVIGDKVEGKQPISKMNTIV